MPAVGLALSALLLGASALWALAGRRSAMDVSAVALVVALLASPIAWVHYTLFLLPLLISRWRLEGVRLVAALLIVPVPFIISQFGRSPAEQATVGSIYNWALVLLLLVLIGDELRRTGLPNFRSAWWRTDARASQS
jgi:hypothetical protein